MLKINDAKPIQRLMTFMLICSGISGALGADADKLEAWREKRSNTSLQDYVNLDYHSKLDVILAAKNWTIEDIRYVTPRRALCVALVFGSSDEGNRQLASVLNVLKKAAERNVPLSAERITEDILTKKFCPEGKYSSDGELLGE